MAEENDAEEIWLDDEDSAERTPRYADGPWLSPRYAMTPPPPLPFVTATSTTGLTTAQGMDPSTPVSPTMAFSVPSALPKRKWATPSANQFSFGTASPTPGSAPIPMFKAGSNQPSQSSFFGQEHRLPGHFPAGSPFSGQTGTFSPFTRTRQIHHVTFGSGTPIPFNPTHSSDTEVKNGLSTPVSTKFQSIAFMKEYKTKSLEELRYEDYQLNRKGPQETGLFGIPVSPSGPARNIFQPITTTLPLFTFGSDGSAHINPSSRFLENTDPDPFGSSRTLGSPTTSPAFDGEPTLRSPFVPNTFTSENGTGSLFMRRSAPRFPFPSTTTPSNSMFVTARSSFAPTFGHTSSLFGHSPAFGIASPSQTFGYGGSTFSSSFGPNPLAGGDGRGEESNKSFSFGATPPPQQGFQFQAVSPSTGNVIFCGDGTYNPMLVGLEHGRQYLLVELDQPTPKRSRFTGSEPATKTWRFGSGK